MLKELADDGPQTATPAARPKWREDDAGAGHGVTSDEIHRMLDVVKERLLQLSKGNASRIASLLQTGLRQPEELPKVLALMEPFTQAAATDEDRETLRAVLRVRIHWHCNYDESPAAELDECLGPVEALYERLAPRDLVVPHRWLFDKDWIDLPTRDREDFQEQEKATVQSRISALTEIHQTYGIIGIENLIAACAEPGIVGFTLPKVPWRDEISWPEWIVAKGGDFTLGAPMTQCISAFIPAIPPPASGDLLQKVIAFGRQAGWDAAKIPRFLIMARMEQEIWRLANSCGPDIYKAYWQGVRPYRVHNKDDLEFILEHLLEAKRPRTALWYCQYSLEKIDPRQLFAALQQLLYAEEKDGPKIEPYHLTKILGRLQNSDEIEKNELIQLEFSLFPALRYGREYHAAALYKAIMSEPALFTDLIRLCYKPEHGEQEKPTAATQAAAKCAFGILYACKRLPGTQADGSIDGEAFTRYHRRKPGIVSQGGSPDRV